MEFSKKLAKHGDIYVNDAFGTAHRAHASTTIVAQFFDEKCAGLVMAAELDNAKKVMEKAAKPFTAIMGGAKISDKILIIENLLDKVNNLIIGGGMAYTFFKALGGSIGNSLVEEDKLDLAKELIQKAKSKGVDLILPIDSAADQRKAAVLRGVYYRLGYCLCSFRKFLHFKNTHRAIPQNGFRSLDSFFEYRYSLWADI